MSIIEDSLLMRIFGYFLALFPVFTLSTSFPIIAITLRNNFQNAILGSNLASYPWAVQRLLFPILSVVSSLIPESAMEAPLVKFLFTLVMDMSFFKFQIPPVLVALVSENLEILVRITGSFAGAGIQYIIPAFLVYFARKEVQKLPLGDRVNTFASPFSGTAWVLIVLLWATACILLVLVNLIKS